MVKLKLEVVLELSNLSRLVQVSRLKSRVEKQRQISVVLQLNEVGQLVEVARIQRRWIVYRRLRAAPSKGTVVN